MGPIPLLGCTTGAEGLAFGKGLDVILETACSATATRKPYAMAAMASMVGVPELLVGQPPTVQPEPGAETVVESAVHVRQSL
jgi:hypothetical protein